ncbi:MAG: GNAT family N-acetyltransferase [candidate division WOR-3 bacterium]
MKSITVIDVTRERARDLCELCVPRAKRDDPNWLKGAAEKEQWVLERLDEWGQVAKLAYDGSIPVGMIQFRPNPEEEVVWIDCIWVPEERYWGKGVATRLLADLLAAVTRPLAWFANRQPLAVVTKTFPGGAKNQLTAREFFTRRGFRQVGPDPDLLFHPLVEGFVHRPKIKPPANYRPQEEDRGRVLIVCGPNPCPATYPLFLKRMESYIRELDADVPISWLDAARNPEEVKIRQLTVGDCVVNRHLMRSFVLDREGFQKEALLALQNYQDDENRNRSD